MGTEGRECLHAKNALSGAKSSELAVVGALCRAQSAFCAPSLPFHCGGAKISEGCLRTARLFSLAILKKAGRARSTTDSSGVPAASLNATAPHACACGAFRGARDRGF